MQETPKSFGSFHSSVPLLGLIFIRILSRRRRYSITVDVYWVTRVSSTPPFWQLQQTVVKQLANSRVIICFLPVERINIGGGFSPIKSRRRRDTPACAAPRRRNGARAPLPFLTAPSAPLPRPNRRCVRVWMGGGGGGCHVLHSLNHPPPITTTPPRQVF